MVISHEVIRLTSVMLIACLLLLPEAQGNTHSASTSNQTAILKPTIPLEQLISQTRKQHGYIVVHSARLTGQEQQRTYVINYVDGDQQWMRTVYDAYTGRMLDNVSLKSPMPVEKSLVNVQNKYPGMTLVRTWLDNRQGELARLVELVDAKRKRREVTLDAYTGQILRDFTYDITLNGKEISLSQVLTKAREQHRGMVVLQTRSALKNNIRVREIIYLDENRMRRKMTVNTLTGEVISDRITPVIPI